MQRNYWKQLRRVCQVLGFVLFLALFRLTDYTGSDTIPYAVNIFFRIDPLVGACVTLAKMSFLYVLWPCLVTLALTLVLGRFFCGWICPFGLLSGYLSKLNSVILTKPLKIPVFLDYILRSIKYFLAGFFVWSIFVMMPGDAVEPVFEDLYKSVTSGEEARITLEKNGDPNYRENLEEELSVMHNSEMWQAGAAVRSLRPENWKES